MRNRPIFDVVALLARCGVGAVFLAHGWQKIQVGITATGRNLDVMGAPVPTAAAVYATFVELLGGAALILGLALPVAGTLLFLDMAGAFAFIHVKHGIFLVDNGKVDNGFELVLLLGLASLMFATGAGGRITLDRRLFGRGRDDDLDDDDLPFLPEEPPPGGRPAVAGLTAPAPIGPVEPPSSRRRSDDDLVTGTTRDVIVAGKKTEPASEDTVPTRSRKKRT
jgi:putative oxidoreductase